MEPWCVPADLPEDSRLDSVDLQECCWAASEVVSFLTMSQYGVGTTKVRPAPADGTDAMPWWAYAAFTGPSGITYDRAFPIGRACATNGVILRGRNVRNLTVKVDGVVLTADQYRLYSGRRLVRVNGAWPASQRLDVDDSQPGTWSIQYGWGLAPPHLGVMASKAMAVELGLASIGADETQLPARVTTITRTGVTAVVQEPLAVLKDGFTGVAVVDQFIAAVNPMRQRRPSRVFSPDAMINYREAPA